MYSDSELDAAVAAGALTPDAAAGLRDFVARQRASPAADEEQFRLITSFNDLFVSIAALLMLAALFWLGRLLFSEFGSAAVAVASWGFAEYFTRRRRMALPSIVLLLSFVGGVFACGTTLGARGGFPALGLGAAAPVVFGSGLAVIAAYAHWRRFQVPITVAAGVAAAVALVLTLVIALDFERVPRLYPVVFAAGIVVFALAMGWDASDRERRTRRADVAFWLHLLAAPLIIHPAFAMLGLVGAGAASVPHAAIAIALYVLLALVALVIDRRAVLVSALVYVVYAMSALLRAAGSLSESFALTALIIGAALLLLSAFWHPVRQLVVGRFPSAIRALLPAV